MSPTMRHALLRGLAYLFVFSTVFDSYTFPFLRKSDNMGRLVGMALVGSFIMVGPIRMLLRGKDVKWFLGFLLIGSLEELYRASILGAVDARSSYRAFFTYVQVILLFLMIRDITRDARAFRGMILTYIIVFSGLSLLTNLNVPMVTNTMAGGRVSPAGMNPNETSFLYALLVVGVVSWILATWPNMKARHYLLMAAGLSLMLAHVRTGSRGGSFALVAGLTFTSAFHFRMRRLPTYLVVLPPILAGMLQIMATSDILAPRVEQTLQYRDTGTRYELAQGGISLFAEEPLKGHGPAYVTKLGERMGLKRISVHNTYLQILVSYGMLGFVPYLAGLLTLLIEVWRKRRAVWGATMLTALCMFLTFGMGGGMGYNRHFWMFLALVGNAHVVGSVMDTKRRKAVPAFSRGLRRRMPVVPRRDRRVPPRTSATFHWSPSRPGLKGPDST